MRGETPGVEAKMRGLETLYVLLTYNGNPVPPCKRSALGASRDRVFYLKLHRAVSICEGLQQTQNESSDAAKSKRLGMAKNVRIDCLPTDRLTADRGM